MRTEAQQTRTTVKTGAQAKPSNILTGIVSVCDFLLWNNGTTALLILIGQYLNK
jgi:hypothetical protein